MKVRSLGQLGEFGLITEIQNIAALNLEARKAGVVGIGDDCAAIPISAFVPQAPGYLIQTTDALVEGRHFRLEWGPARSLGKKLLAVSASDIAAMGGVPRWAVVVIALPGDLPSQYVLEMYEGLAVEADSLGVSILGGDTVASQEFQVSLTLTGTSPGMPLLRSGAQVDDDVWLSGSIGRGYYGRMLLEMGELAQSHSEEEHESILHYLEPSARIALGQKLREENWANSAIDVSDGLLQDAGHIAKRSDVSIELDEEAIPLAPGLQARGFSRAQALSGGDDYELLFTAPASVRGHLERLSGALRVSRIGIVRQGLLPAVTVRTQNECLLASDYCQRHGVGHVGHDHFGA